MSKIKIALVDDHQVVIDGLVSMLRDHEGIEIAYSTTSQDDLLSYLNSHQPDVIMVDIHMPEMSGVNLCQLILQQHKQSRILIFSGFDDTHYVRQVLRNGALGYVLKNASKSVVLDAIHAVYDRKEYIDDTIKKQIIQESLTGQKTSLFEIPLTRREKEILKLIAEENTSQEIADKLFLSLRTVETHRSNLTRKLEAKNTASLVKEAIKRGLIN